LQQAIHENEVAGTPESPAYQQAMEVFYRRVFTEKSVCHVPGKFRLYNETNGTGRL